ncbi:hypothetical protein GCM10009133_20160 [Cocleimonas flava]|uniref:YXWGXW repeat-containing protein n=1 Tax=Cocleimonas flava TaxID=634765 RepID=A0A4R1EYG2_9GAMM|nr:hypothetical protein [Cocleimonas flava]TCJ84939.1 hypothetical protein EV695_2902 [Cocleimonas flava]
MMSIRKHQSLAVKLTMVLMTFLMLSACGGGKSSTSVDENSQETLEEKAKWGFKWDDGHVWQ